MGTRRLSSTLEPARLKVAASTVVIRSLVRPNLSHRPWHGAAAHRQYEAARRPPEESDQHSQPRQRTTACYLYLDGPAELIVTNGPMVFVPIQGTSLEYAVNTTADVFREPTDHERYLLTSGRWLRSWRTEGSWQFVASRDLPATSRGFQTARRRRRSKLPSQAGVTDPCGVRRRARKGFKTTRR